MEEAGSFWVYWNSIGTEGAGAFKEKVMDHIHNLRLCKLCQYRNWSTLFCVPKFHLFLKDDKNHHFDHGIEEKLEMLEFIPIKW